MIDWFRAHFTRSGNTQDEVEREKMAALDEAEQTLASLTERSEKAVHALTEREDRNHWRESIQNMINGVA